MIYSEALEAMKQGKTVKRKSWKDAKMYLYKGFVITMNLQAVSQADKEADDWEIVGA